MFVCSFVHSPLISRRYYGLCSYFYQKVQQEFRRDNILQNDWKELKGTIRNNKLATTVSVAVKSCKGKYDATIHGVQSSLRRCFSPVSSMLTRFKRTQKSISVDEKSSKPSWVMTNFKKIENWNAVKRLKFLRNWADNRTISYSKNMKQRLKGVPSDIRTAAEEKLKMNEDVIRDNTTLDLVPVRARPSIWSRSRELWVNMMLRVSRRYPRVSSVAQFTRNKFEDLTSRVSSWLFEETEEAQVYAEIAEKEPDFDRELFLNYVEKEMVPTVLNSYMKGDLQVLTKICSQPAFHALATLIAERPIGQSHSRLLAVRKIELVNAKYVNDLPTLLITFFVQHVHYIKDTSGKVVFGSANDVKEDQYVWALRHDPSAQDPRWEILETFVQQSELIY